VHIIVIGVGPIGGIIGGRLARAGNDIMFVDIDQEHVAAIRENGLQVDVPDGPFRVNIKVVFPNEIEGKYDLVMIAVRSNYTSDALNTAMPHLADDGLLVSMQNGINPPLFEERVGPDREALDGPDDALRPGVGLHADGVGRAVPGGDDEGSALGVGRGAEPRPATPSRRAARRGRAYGRYDQTALPDPATRDRCRRGSHHAEPALSGRVHVDASDRGMMGWDPAYTERVLEPDYGFAGRYLFHHFIDALIAHADTVQRLSLCAARAPDCARLRAALVRLREEPVPLYEAEIPDLCSAIHRRLERDLGEAVAGLLRIGLSRNDLDMTVYKMRAREVLLQIGLSACALRDVILRQAERHTETVLVAHTHHRPGQPTTVAHYLSAIENALSRDVQRQRQVYARLNTCPLGSAALAGSSYGLDRRVTAGLLGFDAPVSNTYDAVASSDWQVDIVTAAQSCALNRPSSVSR
jgi:hypothetical protein